MNSRPEIDWTTPLQSQQSEFIERLYLGVENLRLCSSPGKHGEVKTISSSHLRQLRAYCWEMVEKYQSQGQTARQIFTNHMKGKLGEEVTKECLGDLVNQVEYAVLPTGDEKIDLTLRSDGNVSVQVKTRCSSANEVLWSVSSEEIRKNKALVCVLICEDSKRFDEFKDIYRPIMAGFLPTDLVERQIDEGALSWVDRHNDKFVNIKVDNLLYGGGLRSYLEYWNTKSLDEIALANLKGEKWELLYTLSTETNSRIRCLDFHPGNQVLASGGEDHTIRMWSLNTKKLLSQYKRYYYGQDTGDVNSLVFSPDRKSIISTGFISGSNSLKNEAQKKIQISDWRTGRMFHFFPNLSLSDKGFSLALDSNSNTLACDGKYDIHLYDYCTKKYLKSLKGRSARINSVAFSPDGQILVSGDEDGQVRVWDWRTDSLTHVYSEHSAEVNTVGVSPDNKILASGGADKNIKLFDLAKKETVLELHGHTGAINSSQFSYDGQILASGSDDNTIKIWHVKTGELLYTLGEDSHWKWKGVWSVAFSRDDRLLAAGFSGEIKVWQRS